jgi:hypothetical protein
MTASLHPARVQPLHREEPGHARQASAPAWKVWGGLALLALWGSVGCRPKKAVICPGTVQVAPMGRASFRGQLTGLAPAGWSWSVQEFAGGTVDQGGTYEADREGTFHVVWANPRYPRLNACATVKVADLSEVIPSQAQLRKDEPIHRATPLADGRVLLTGSQYPDGDDAGLYDPALDRYTPLPRTGMSMGGHTATRLRDGRVLLIGDGRAVLFDPVQQRFSPAGRPLEARRNHSATLLEDGRVLVAGGTCYDGQGFPASATLECFDPADGEFHMAGRMLSRRAGHTATLLPDGEILFAGGFCVYDPARSALGSAECYNPTSCISTGLEAGMGTVRVQHQAFLLTDGTVLLLGGLTYPSQAQMADRFDPVTRQFTPTGPMTVARNGFTAIQTADGRVLVAGGDADGVERFDPGQGLFTPLPFRLRSARLNGTLAMLPSGHVWLAGGFDPQGRTVPSCEIIR